MTFLRITGGTLRGRKVAVPKNEVRPTSEKARQAYFDIVGPSIAGARFLDLFAGSGIFSFEALSRGARESVAIDASRQNTAAIDRTAREWDLSLRTITADALAGMKRAGSEVFDLVYADPPYDYAHYDALLASIDSDLPLRAGATVAIEHRRRTNPFTMSPVRLQPTRTATYGEVWITFFIA